MFLLALGIADMPQLNAVTYIMGNLVQVGIIAIIVLFQPEIRQILEKMGSRNIKIFKAFGPSSSRRRWRRPSTRRSSPAARCPRARPAC